MATNCRRSPFFYVGDKFKLVPQLNENFPEDIDRFIEPFCGGGSVFLNARARRYLLNDIDRYVIELHRFLISSGADPRKFWSDVRASIEKYGLSASFMGRDVPAEYRKEFPKTYFAKYNKAAYVQMKGDFNCGKGDMLLLYLLLIYGFNRMLRFNLKGDFNLPVGNVDFNKNVVAALSSYFEYVSGRDISLFNMDFQDFLGTVQPTPRDFVYLDPPYLITSSEYNKRWNEASEARLTYCLDKLDARGVRFAVSNVLQHRNRRNDTFGEWAQKYNVVKIRSNYISFNDNSTKDTLEILVKNY